MKICLGAELEGYVKTPQGEFADTLSLLGEDGWKSKVHPFETLGSDVAACSLEATTTKCESSQAIGESLRRALAQLPVGHTLNFVPRTPYPGEIPVAKKARYAVMAKALSREHASGFNGMLQVGPWNATHFHIGVEKVLSNEATLLLNFLNNISPYARLQVVDTFKIQGAEGHLAIWKDFTRRERLPAPRWFAHPCELTQLVESIPKLFVKENEEWKMGNGEKSKLGDPASEGVMWWLARPRLTFGTVEWRPFPSMQPVQVELLAGEIFRLVSAFYALVEKYPHWRYATDYAQEVVWLYQHLSAESWLVPKQPLSQSKWWELFHR